VEPAALRLSAWELVDADLVDAANVDDDLFDSILVDAGNVGAAELVALWLAAWELVDARVVDAGNVDADLEEAVLVDAGSVDADLVDSDLRRSRAPTLKTPAQPSANPDCGPAGTTGVTSSQAGKTTGLLRSERRERPRQRKAP
jgi:hypothetical protein